MKIPEILAPAGNYQAFLGAVASGADAVYIGGKQFNARQYADNFSDSEMARALDYAHLRNRRIYVTLNIVLDDPELEEALEYVFRLQKMGVDAVIVQDLGLISLLGQVFPALKLHASTQMTIHNWGGVKFLAGMGLRRVVLARELSRGEIEEIGRRCPDIEREIFVHGALCYSYSGLCLMSSLVGGRSGNRGRCAQPCRMIYRTDYHNSRFEGHLMSPADLCLIEKLPEIAAAGVDSLKIEGRMKRPEYVAVVTKTYREALDRLAEDGEGWSVFDHEKQALAGIFNRNFTINQWEGKNRKVLSPQRSNNRGVMIGRVVKQAGEMALIKLSASLRLGDGIEVWVSKGTNPAAVINRMWVDDRPVEKADAGEVVSVFLPGRVSPGDRVFRTHDHALLTSIESSFLGNREQDRIPVTVRARVEPGQKLLVEFVDEEGNRGVAESASTAVPAQTAPLDEATLKEKLGKLGNTAWKVARWDIRLEPGTMLPFRELNEARRQASEDLLNKRLAQRRPASIDEAVFDLRLNSLVPRAGVPYQGKPALSVRVAGMEEAWAALDAGADRIYLNLGGLQGNIMAPGEIISIVEAAKKRGRQLFLDVPAVIRSGDNFSWEEIRAFNPTGVLVGNPGGLYCALDSYLAVQADYTMNVFNRWSAGYLSGLGVAGICLSVELSRTQLKSMLPLAAGAEYIVHGLFPIMISEHCIRGNLAGERCANPSCRDLMLLKDQKGYEFPVVADKFCRAHVFNSRTACLVEEMEDIMNMGFRHLRIEGLLDSPRRVAGVVGIYRQVIDELAAGKKVDLGEARKKLEQLALSPFTKLHFYRGVE